jgi:hypothetical protein
MTCVCVVLVVILAGGGDVLAQTDDAVGQVRITVSSTVTKRELAAMLGASEATVTELDRMITLRSPDGQKRVVPAPGTSIIGVLLAVDDLAVVLKSDRRRASSPFTVPRAAIAKVERMAGRHSRARYTAFGALLGFGVGGLAGFASVSCQPNEWFCSRGLGVLAGAVVGTTVGATTGAIMPPARRWIPLDEASLGGESLPLDQPAASLPSSKFRRLTFSVDTGQPSSGPAHDLEAAMHTAGFTDASPGFFGPPIDHPFSRNGFWEIGRPMALESSYALSPSLSVGVAGSQTPIGETFGYRSAGMQYLNLQYRVTTVGVVVLRTYSFFRFGGGPALHWTQMRNDPAPEPDPAARNPSWSSHSRVGFIGIAGVRLPSETRVYLDLSVQYRHLGRTAVGPFTPTSYGISATPLPASEAQFSHWFLAFGPGVRF